MGSTIFVFTNSSYLNACQLTTNGLYNGPVISDHSSKNYREHGKIQQESKKETTP